MKRVKIKNGVELLAAQWMVDPTSECLKLAPNGRIKQAPWFLGGTKSACGLYFGYYGHNEYHPLSEGDWIVKWNDSLEILSDESFKEKYEVVE